MVSSLKDDDTTSRAVCGNRISMKHMTRAIKFYVERLAEHLKISLEPSTADMLKILDPDIKQETKGRFAG